MSKLFIIFPTTTVTTQSPLIIMSKDYVCVFGNSDFLSGKRHVYSYRCSAIQTLYRQALIDTATAPVTLGYQVNKTHSLKIHQHLNTSKPKRSNSFITETGEVIVGPFAG